MTAFGAGAPFKKKGHRIYVSEYSAPDGVECIWSKQVALTLDPNTSKRPTEKLFRL